MFDNNNPAVIVNNLFKINPDFETAKYNINFDIINSILSSTIASFNITKEEFDVLFKIKPIRFELPLENRDDFLKHLFVEGVGEYTIDKGIECMEPIFLLISQHKINT